VLSYIINVVSYFHNTCILFPYCMYVYSRATYSTLEFIDWLLIYDVLSKVLSYVVHVRKYGSTTTSGSTRK
jgi:hypothetical protein